MKTRMESVNINEVPALAARLKDGFDVPVSIEIDGREVAILMPPAGLRQLLRDRETLRRLALGDLEFAASEGHPLDEVLADCDLLLDET